MRIYRLLSIGLLLVAGCSTTSPFATTAQTPVPLGAQSANNAPGATSGSGQNQFSALGAGSQQQLAQTGSSAYTQSNPQSGNPFLAGLRATTASIGNALTIQPKVIPATHPTSLAHEPTNIGADLHFQAAQVYEGQQNIPGAITHFQKALEKSPRDPKILVAFGRLYDRQGDLKTAEGLYQQALQIDPNNCAALNAVGICYAKQGNLDIALAQLSRAAQLQPQNARYKNNMANVLADAGRIEEAYAQLVSVHGPAVAHYNLGYLLKQQGKTDLARRELGLALQANPYMEEARKVLETIEPAVAPVQPTNVGFENRGRYSVSQPFNSQPINSQPFNSQPINSQIVDPRAASSPMHAAPPRWPRSSEQPPFAGPQNLPSP